MTKTSEKPATRKRLRRLATTIAATLALGAAAAPVASAEFGIAGFDGASTADSAGAPYTQAGGHPYEFVTRIDYNTHEELLRFPDADIKNVDVELPPGILGNPSGVATCSAKDFLNSFGATATQCPYDTQVGIAIVDFFGFPERFPLYSITPTRDVPAMLGFSVVGVRVLLEARVRSGSDYGISITTEGISQGLPINGTEIVVWGVPADPSHDKYRCAENNFGGCDPNADGNRKENSITTPPKAFMTLPTACTAPGVGLESRMRADSWQNPGAFERASFESHLPPGLPTPRSEWGPPQGPTGCENVPFEPTFTATPTTNAADSPSGLNVDITVPQEALVEPNGIVQSHLKRAEVKLPAGMSVNPSSADGLGSCSAAQIGLGNSQSPSCPNDSKIGQVEIETPVLEKPLTGGVYLAKQGDNPFNSLLALYMVAEGSGVVVKLPGRVIADPTTGQLTTVFDDNPQLPFSRLHVALKGGPRAPLRTPPSCGTFITQSTLAPWSGNAAVAQGSAFKITNGPSGSGCPNQGFDPKLNAGTQNPVAGSFSPFVLKLSRADGTRELNGLKVALPKGLIGKLAGIPYCSDSALGSISGAEGAGATQIASPSCPGASQVANVTVGAGAGLNPLYVKSGKAYLAGPYKGAPLSLAIVTPAVAGPFDLGNVLVRTALQVDPETAAITAVSDPLPTILYGIPLDLRSVEVDMSRPGFTLNPTSCAPMAIDAAVSGVGGTGANLSNPFQVGNCSELGFKPKLKLRVKGGTKRGQFPAFEATLTARPGDANIGRASVALPHSEFLAQNHIKTICTRVQYAADSCPKGSIYGYARATTPLLDQPLEGPVYLRSSSNELPDLVAALHGQIEIDLVGRIDSVNGGIRNTFDLVPDAPVTKFVLKMSGGKKGLLENSRDICKSKNRANALFDGQNGKTADSRPVLVADCGKKARKGKGKGKTKPGKR